MLLTNRRCTRSTSATSFAVTYRSTSASARGADSSSLFASMNPVHEGAARLRPPVALAEQAHAHRRAPHAATPAQHEQQCEDAHHVVMAAIAFVSCFCGSLGSTVCIATSFARSPSTCISPVDERLHARGRIRLDEDLARELLGQRELRRRRGSVARREQPVLEIDLLVAARRLHGDVDLDGLHLRRNLQIARLRRSARRPSRTTRWTGTRTSRAEPYGMLAPRGMGLRRCLGEAHQQPIA